MAERGWDGCVHAMQKSERFKTFIWKFIVAVHLWRMIEPKHSCVQLRGICAIIVQELFILAFKNFPFAFTDSTPSTSVCCAAYLSMVTWRSVGMCARVCVCACGGNVLWLRLKMFIHKPHWIRGEWRTFYPSCHLVRGEDVKNASVSSNSHIMQRNIHSRSALFMKYTKWKINEIHLCLQCYYTTHCHCKWKRWKKNTGILCNFLLKMIVFFLLSFASLLLCDDNDDAVARYLPCCWCWCCHGLQCAGGCSVRHFFHHYLSSFYHPIVCSCKSHTTIDSSVKNMERLCYGVLLSTYTFFFLFLFSVHFF